MLFSFKQGDHIDATNLRTVGFPLYDNNPVIRLVLIVNLSPPLPSSTVVMPIPYTDTGPLVYPDTRAVTTSPPVSARRCSRP